MKLALYIHLPYCVSKCGYCDFNAYEKPKIIPEQQYLDKLKQDLVDELDFLSIKPEITSIYLGGGTPTLFSIKFFANLFNYLNKLNLIKSNIEITIEANPTTHEQTNFEQIAKLGVNRISLGVQSFNDKFLQILGRAHNSKTASIAIEKAKKYFKKINIDLMYCLPKQNVKQTIADLEKSISFGTDHISWYKLTVEPNTKFFLQKIKQPDEDIEYEMYDKGLSLLKSYSFERYEISAYTKNSHYCKHNLNYWGFGDYLGIGCGAHGKISLDNKVYRSAKIKSPISYLTKQNIINYSKIADSEIDFEIMLNTLRSNLGCRQRLWQYFSNNSWYSLKNKLAIYFKDDFLNLKNSKEEEIIYSTNKGKDYLNDILYKFLA